MHAHGPSPHEAGADTPREGLRGLWSASIDALHTRLDLAAVELEIVLRTLVRVLVWAVGAIACAMLALGFGVTALIVALWDTHRMLALLGGGVVFVALAVTFAVLAARTLHAQPGMLQGSLEQLQEDRDRAGGSP